MGQTGNKEVTLGQTGEGSGRQGNEMKTKDRLKKIREGWVTEITLGQYREDLELLG